MIFTEGPGFLASPVWARGGQAPLRAQTSVFQRGTFTGWTTAARSARIGGAGPRRGRGRALRPVCPRQPREPRRRLAAQCPDRKSRLEPRTRPVSVIDRTAGTC